MCPFGDLTTESEMTVVAKMIRILLLLVLVGAAVGAAAQDSLRIAAVVNDEVISAYDLNSRLRLVVTTSRLDSSPEALQRLGPQVLRTLVDEKLKLQAAKQFSIALTETELQNALSSLEQQNNLAPGQLDAFLNQSGISKEELIKQIRAEVSWVKTVQRKMGPLINIGEEEITQRLREIEENVGKPEYHISEVFLSVDDPARDNDALQLADRLLQQIRSGASLPALARSFSQNASAAVGGDLGWVQPGQLAPEVEAAVEKMQPSQFSTPIRSAIGYHIVYLHDRRLNPGIGGSEIVLNLAQLFLPLRPQAGDAEIQSQTRRAEEYAHRANSCEDMERLAQDLGTRQSGRVGDVRLNNLPPAVRAIVLGIQDNKASVPHRFPEGITVLMVCERKTVRGDVDERKRVEQMLSSQRMENASRQYLRDLRRTAFVDIRL